MTRPAKRVAIVQSSYIPWKGYFDLMRAVDEFILLDEVQFTKRDWRSRNRIKTAQGPLWLSIPVQTKGLFHQAIKDTEISDAGWAQNHWRSISTHYAKAPHFARYRDAMEVNGRRRIVRDADGIHLSGAGAGLAAERVLEAVRRDFGD